jgi:uncharacterized protein
MKVLFFVDTHDLKNLKKISDKAKDADTLVCAGDFTVFERDMTAALQELNNIGKPVLIIHGNHETSSSVMMECRRLKNLEFIHKNYYIIGDIVFYGFGGGGFSIRDESFTQEAEKFMQEFKSISEKNFSENKKHYRLVLVTHAPPFGTKVDEIGAHAGNQNITEFIIKHQPIIAVCGHIHENAGVEDKINQTRIINPGWNGIILEL